jgi:hypothetical protein
MGEGNNLPFVKNKKKQMVPILRPICSKMSGQV